MARPHEPDLRLGVFETMLVREGEPVALAAHLRRLADSLAALYGLPLPAEAKSTALGAATDLPLGRLRLTAVPDLEARPPADAEPRLEAAAAEVDPAIVFPAQGVRLRSHNLPGGLGPHKVADRPAIERPAAGPGPLLVDDGEALEAGWGSLFVVSRGALATPPLDGRILPGTTRAAILEVAARERIEIEERPVAVDELPRAEEVFLAGSVRGIEGAVELDGARLAGLGRLSRRLAAELRLRWRLPAPPDAAPAPGAGPRPGRSAR